MGNFHFMDDSEPYDSSPGMLAVRGYSNAEIDMIRDPVLLHDGR